MRIFGREPAIILAAVATAIRLISAYWIHLSDDQQAVLNAVATAFVGLVIASIVKDGIVAAFLGFIQAMIALAIGFGLHIPAEAQAIIMSLTSAAAAMFIRTQVTAPVPASAAPGPVTRR